MIYVIGITILSKVGMVRTNHLYVSLLSVTVWQYDGDHLMAELTFISIGSPMTAMMVEVGI